MLHVYNCRCDFANKNLVIISLTSKLFSQFDCKTKFMTALLTGY